MGTDSSKKSWQYKTYMINMQMIEMHINPLIGKVKMQKLTPKHIDVMFMELRQKKVTGSKARNKKDATCYCNLRLKTFLLAGVLADESVKVQQMQN